jgi:ABC-type sugar transport system permease subunit
VSSGSSTEYGGMIDFEAILLDLQLPKAVSDLFQGYLSNLFNLIWSCGVQTILFLAGLQSIPKQLYEVGTIEGCSRWETFWFLEIPSLRNIIQLVLIYTMIDQFTSLSSPVMKQATNLMFSHAIYDRSSAILWTYFLIVGVVMAIILVLYNRLCVRRWE